MIFAVGLSLLLCVPHVVTVLNVVTGSTDSAGGQFIVMLIRTYCHIRVQSYICKEHTAMWYQTNMDPTLMQYKVL